MCPVCLFHSEGAMTLNWIDVNGFDFNCFC